MCANIVNGILQNYGYLNSNLKYFITVKILFYLSTFSIHQSSILKL